MFEEICIVCGKHLHDDGRAYCSDNCQTSDLASPSISSSSSALSSPQLGYAQGGEVPALMPSALGSALRKYQRRDQVHVKSSVSASNIWSYINDDDEDDLYGRGGEYGISEDNMYDGSSKSANYIYSMTSALSYARRPSGTNTHSTVPQVHQPNSNASPAPRTRPKDRRGGPRNVASRSQSSTTDEDADLSDYSLSSRDIPDDADSDKDQSNRSETASSKLRRSRNRASLPACFSLLKMNSPPSKEASTKTSPVSSSSARTLARASPPTPRHPHPDHSARTVLHHHTIEHDTPRGRQRYSDRSMSSRRSNRSSPPRSRSRHVRRPESPRPVANARPDNRGNVEQVFDWDNVVPPRGRTTIRRNSSPPPRLLTGVDDPGRMVAAVRDEDRLAQRSQSSSKSQNRRGRVGVDELDGVGTFALAPGYGIGRSGLMDRERFAALRVPL